MNNREYASPLLLIQPFREDIIGVSLDNDTQWDRNWTSMN